MVLLPSQGSRFDWTNTTGVASQIDLPLGLHRLQPDGAFEQVEATQQVLRSGWPTCPSWGLWPTLLSFLEGVTKALVYTPAFCMLAILLGKYVPFLNKHLGSLEVKMVVK